MCFALFFCFCFCRTPLDLWCPLLSTKSAAVGTDSKAALHVSINAKKKDANSPVPYFRQVAAQPRFQLRLGDGLVLPGRSEELEWVKGNVTLSMGGHLAIGTLYLTQYRVAFVDQRHNPSSKYLADDSEFSMFASDQDLTTFVNLKKILSVEKIDEKSNLKSRDKVVSLTFLCLDFLRFKVTFASGINQELLDAFETRLHHKKFNLSNFPPTTSFRSSFQEASSLTNDFALLNMVTEMERQRVPSSKWRLSEVNAKYGVCESYPAKFFVPVKISDDLILKAAKFRSKGRLPVLTWYNSRKGNAILRCAQPNVGIVGGSSKEDQTLVEEARILHHQNSHLTIFDARSRLAAEVPPFFTFSSSSSSSSFLFSLPA